MTRASAGLAALLFGASAAPALGAIPPAYGGTVRWPAPHGLRAPSASAPRSPFEAALAHAIYDGLYTLDDDGEPVPALAAAMPEPIEAGHRIHLRAGLVRHDGHALDGAEVLRSLERSIAAESSAFLLAPLAGPEGRLAAMVDADGAIVIRSPLTGLDLATRLAALPCAIVPALTGLGRSRGTGPFQAVPTSDGVDLRASRRSASAAPYLGMITIAGPRAPGRELRDLELGRLHGSWFGASLYGLASSPTDRLELARVGLVVAVADGRQRGREALAWLAAHLDRSRLRRSGVVPARSVFPGLPPPAHGHAHAPAALGIHAPADDAFSSAVARELAAQADAQGVSAALTPRPVHSSAPTIRVVTIVPPLPGAAAALGAAFAAAGQADRARAVGLDGRRARESAPRLEAVVLGLRRDVLFHRRRLEGLRTDAHGLPVLAELYIRRGTALGRDERSRP